MKKEIIIIMLLLLCAPPVAAVMYSEEYYKLGTQSINEISMAETDRGLTLWAKERASIATYYELRRQTILLEKQNELQVELVKAQWVAACYTPENTVKRRSY